MRDDFCVFILTHGRPDNVRTYRTLRSAGYTGRIYLVIDDEDKNAARYRTNFPGEVLTFCKRDEYEATDAGDNSGDMRTPLFARNACWSLAEQVGCLYFIQLDDDYTSFEFTVNASLNWGYSQIRDMNSVLSALVDYLDSACAVSSVAMAQGGDFIGGSGNVEALSLRRKAMNSFVCCTERPFRFVSRLNDDVSTYTNLGRRGLLFFTVLQLKLVQGATQANAGGLTEAYLDAGTYVKSFFTVMYAPSCTSIGVLGDHRSPHFRIHHQINWHRTAPKILRETHRKDRC